MSDTQESCTRITRSRVANSKKQVQVDKAEDKTKTRARASKRPAGELNACSATKKRAVLGDVTNVVLQLNAQENVGITTVKSQVRKAKGRPRKDAVALTAKNEAVELPTVSSEAEISSKSQNCVSGEESEDSSKHADIDVGSRDPQMCAAYAQDIYQHLRMVELKKRARANYMVTLQRDITPNMRGILVDWLVEVAEEYKLVPDTLYLTVGYIDRFLSVYPVSRHKLQLLGVTCMLIASKYEEVCPPHVEEFCYITDNTYTKEEMLSMERKVLTFLHFEMTMPTIKTFLRRFVQASQSENKLPSLEMEFLSNYLAELTLLECSFLKYFPSIIAASAVFLSMLTLDFDSTAYLWNSTLQHYTDYKPSQLKECVTEIYGLQLNRKSSALTAIREKYRQHKFKGVTNLSPPPFLPERLFEDIGSEKISDVQLS